MYKIGDIEVMALQGLDLAVEKGEMLAIIGNSGSGKSTLMNIIGGLDRPTAGKIHVNGTDLLKLSDKEMMHYMRETIGFVWQNTARNMIPYLNAIDNVKLVMQMAGKLDVNRANMLLETVGLSGRMRHRPSELSGGEQQRAAIARALLNEPELLLADEPTGNLDTHTGEAILELFTELRKLHPGRSIMMITHNREIAKLADRTGELVDGRLTNQ